MALLDTIFGIRRWQTSDEIIITDVTRMQGDKVCVAGLNQGEPIRLHEPTPKDHWLQSVGGLRPGDVVSLSWKLPRSSRGPHLEDRDWNLPSFNKTSALSEDDLVRTLSTFAFPSIRKAFGKPCFYSESGNAAFTPGKGSRSLASVFVGTIRAFPHQAGIRVDFVDEADEWKMVPFEDLTVRAHQTRCQPCGLDLSGSLTSEFHGSRALLRVGIGRPFEASDLPPGCWLQVNHIFLIPSKRKHFV